MLYVLRHEPVHRCTHVLLASELVSARKLAFCRSIKHQHRDVQL
jgi:hypothetical protein